MGNCHACLRGDRSKQGNLRNKKGPYALLSADEGRKRIQGKSKGKTRNGPKKIHFNDTFEGFRDANASQPDIATQKLQSQEADRNVLKLPRVSEEGLESGSSEAAATPAEEGGGLNEDSKPIQEATQVFVDFGKFEAPRADPEIEETPAKVLVEYEDYQPQSTAPPAQGESALVLLVRGLIPRIWNFIARALMRSHICMHLPLAGRKAHQEQPGVMSPEPQTLRTPLGAFLHHPPYLARPPVKLSGAHSSQTVAYETKAAGDASRELQPAVYETKAADNAQPTGNAENDRPDQQTPSTDGCTEEDLAESRALEEQLRAEVQTARSDVFKTLSTLSDLQARFKMQFIQLQEAMDSKAP